MQVNKIIAALAAVGITILAGCASQPAPPPLLVDGELGLPANYKSWTKFLSYVERPEDAFKQVREIYMNDIATKGTREKGFPMGSVFVMENYAAEANPDGSLKRGPDGKLVKGKLLVHFVMGKNPGWGQAVIEPLRNGNWIYSSYKPNGDKTGADYNTCRVCHLPLGASKDWVHRYDQYFDQKKSSLGTQQSIVAALSGHAAHSTLSTQELGLLSTLPR